MHEIVTDNHENLSQNTETFDVLIVGAGAAGLMAAIACGERFQRDENASARIRVLDSQSKIGAKILVAGGGRCNITNEFVDANRFNTANDDRTSKSFVARVLRSFSVEQTHRFFDSIGVPLVLEPEMGKYFPVANSGKVVLRALLDATQNAGAEIVTNCAVHEIEYSKSTNLWTARTSQGEMQTRAILLCTGGLALPKSGSDGRGLAFAKNLGHEIVATTPALTPLLSNPQIHFNLSGVTLPARLTLRHENQILADFSGSFLFTHIGYSGPLALNISRHFARFHLRNPKKRAQISLRLLPEVRDGDEGRFWHDFVQRNARKTLANALAEILPRRVAESVVESSNQIAANRKTANSDTTNLAQENHDFPNQISKNPSNTNLSNRNSARVENANFAGANRESAQFSENRGHANQENRDNASRNNGGNANCGWRNQANANANSSANGAHSNRANANSSGVNANIEYSKRTQNGANLGEIALGRLSKSQHEAAKIALFDWPLPISDVADYVKAETTAGGVSLEEIESATMMSKLHDGLFFAGEICDVDGWLGGYNFQWAWSSGAIAGRSAAKFTSKIAAEKAETN